MLLFAIASALSGCMSSEELQQRIEQRETAKRMTYRAEAEEIAIQLKSERSAVNAIKIWNLLTEESHVHQICYTSHVNLDDWRTNNTTPIDTDELLGATINIKDCEAWNETRCTLSKKLERLDVFDKQFLTQFTPEEKEIIKYCTRHAVGDNTNPKKLRHWRVYFVTGTNNEDCAEFLWAHNEHCRFEYKEYLPSDAKIGSLEQFQNLVELYNQAIEECEKNKKSAIKCTYSNGEKHCDDSGVPAYMESCTKQVEEKIEQIAKSGYLK